MCFHWNCTIINNLHPLEVVARGNETQLPSGWKLVETIIFLTFLLNLQSIQFKWEMINKNVRFAYVFIQIVQLSVILWQLQVGKI